MGIAIFLQQKKVPVPYDEFLADRIRRSFEEKQISFTEKMMDGLCFRVGDKMCSGIDFEKKKNSDLLMDRVGEGAMEESLQADGYYRAFYEKIRIYRSGRIGCRSGSGRVDLAMSGF